MFPRAVAARVGTSVLVLLVGCADALEESRARRTYQPVSPDNVFLRYYSQVAPTKFPPPEETFRFTYENVSIDEVYELLFNDFLVIGRSRFLAPNGHKEVQSFANSIGADAVITATQFRDIQTRFEIRSVPTASSTSYSGYSGGGSWYGTATTFGTSHVTVPVSVGRFSYESVYLRNVNHVVPLWKRVREQYARTGPSELEGVWFNEHFKLVVYLSGTQVVAFVREPTKIGVVTFAAGDLKFLFGAETGAGVFLMDDATPQPAQFKVNKFGHLEVRFLATEGVVSFARSGPQVAEEAAQPKPVSPAPLQPANSAPPPKCIASDLPEWRSASAAEKKQLLERCR